MHSISTRGRQEVASASLLVFTLTASQADTIEDALLTFAPSAGLIIHPASGEGPALRFDAHLTTESLATARAALLSYAEHIVPRSRTVGTLLALLTHQGGPT